MKRGSLKSKKTELTSGILAIAFVLATAVAGYFVLKATPGDQNAEINDYMKESFIGKNGSALVAGLQFFAVEEFEDGSKLGHIPLEADRQADFKNICMIHFLFDKNLFIREAYVTGNCSGMIK